MAAMTQWRAGQRITASRLADITPIWSAWTPTWNGGDGQFGDAAVDCRYARCGNSVDWTFSLIFGAGTVFPSGSTNWYFSLPVATSASVLDIGRGEIAHDTASSRTPVRARLINGSLYFEVSGGAVDNRTLTGVGLIDTESPWGVTGAPDWDAGDEIFASGTYEIA